MPFPEGKNVTSGQKDKDALPCQNSAEHMEQLRLNSLEKEEKKERQDNA